MSVPKPPPPVSELPAGTILRAGRGTSEVLAVMDWETYSEAGYHWNGKKWDSLPGMSSQKRGIKAVGAAVYSEHPSTEVLSLWYNLKDGNGPQWWAPGHPLPLALLLYTGSIEAHNSGFEYFIWKNVCAVKYGWPEPVSERFRCSMAKNRAYCLPPALDLSGKVLSLPILKDKEGDRLIKKFSVPQQPRKNQPKTRILPSDDPEDFARFVQYNLRDIEAESELSARVPDLPPQELEFYLCDQAINQRGAQMDVEGIENCASIIDQAFSRYDSELLSITDGTVPNASKLQQLQAWAVSQGARVGSMDEEAIECYLGDETLPPKVRRALEIRQLIGSAAVKKLYAMRARLCKDGRIRDMFGFHAARTGRSNGEGPQPTNMPASGPDVNLCGCGRHSVGSSCKWCGSTQITPVEWNPEAAEDALTIISTRSLDMVEHFFGNAVAAVSGCLRGLFVARPGYDLVSSDYSAIEAVVLAALAGEEWRLEVFRTHGKIYEMSAAKISGTPFEEIMQYAKDNGKHHPLRKTVGKVAELACFTRDTQVLTDRGYVGIVDVLISDKLWDGVEWVNHQGVVAKGIKTVLSLDGVEMTPNHPISTGDSWKEARLLVSNASMLRQALENGSENLPLQERSLRTENPVKLNAVVRAVGNPLRALITYAKAKVLDVTPALRERASKLSFPTSKCIGRILTLFPILSKGVDSETGYPPVSQDATMKKTPDIITMAGAAYSYMRNGEQIDGVSSHILRRLKDGIIQTWNWIGSMLTAGMSRVILGSLPNRTIPKTNETCKICNEESNTLRNVYDVVNAGPRNRFTIRTDSGHLIVHNSGYAGWIGAWKAFGADEFMGDDEIKRAIVAWREASPAIVELWGGQDRGLPWSKDYRFELYGVEGMAVSAILNPGTEYTVRGITYVMRGDALYCVLPSGRAITYHSPRLSPSTRRAGTQAISYWGYNTNPKMGAPGWVCMDTYAGKLIENIVQAVACDILRFAIVNLERAGYPVVLHVYDEVTVEIPEGWGSIEEVERIMATLPSWAAGWPIKAAGGWRGKRYRK